MDCDFKSDLNRDGLGRHLAGEDNGIGSGLWHGQSICPVLDLDNVNCILPLRIRCVFFGARQN